MRYIAITMIMACVAGLGTRADDWGQVGRYAESNREIICSPASERRVVFFGNSITELWPQRDASFFNDNGFVGRGISGQSTEQYLVRFRADVIELHPEIVVINGGTNDVAENTCPYDEDRTFGNIVSLVQLAEANGIRPVMTSVLPAASFKWNRSITDAPDKIESLNVRLREYADAHGILYIDYYSALLDGSASRAMPAAYSSDGVHPNAAGYAVMRRVAMDVLGPML